MRVHTCERKACVNANHLELAHKPRTSTGKKLTDDEIDTIWQMHTDGDSKSYIANMLGRSWQSVHYVLTGKRRAAG
jgi:hypothetical protein